MNQSVSLLPFIFHQLLKLKALTRETLFLVSILCAVHQLQGKTPVVNGGMITANAAGGRWDATSTWVGGVVPGVFDKVFIPSGSEVVVRGPYTSTSPAVCRSLTVEGTLTLGTSLSAGARGLQVDSTLVISTGGLLRNDGADTHSLILGGDLVVDGDITFSSSTSIAKVIFSGIQIQSITGSTELVLPFLAVDKLFGEVDATGIAGISVGELTLLSGDFFGPDRMTVETLLKVKEGNFISGDTTKLTGDLTVENGSFSTLVGTLILEGQSLTLSSLSELMINNVTLKTGSVVNDNAKLNLTGTLVIEDGALFNCGNAITVAGATVIGEGGSGELKITQTQGTKTFAGPFIIKEGATFNNSIGDNAHFQEGIDNKGTFLDGTGTNYFEANAQDIKGVLTLKHIFIEPAITVTNNGDVTSTVSFAGPGSWVQGPQSRLVLGGTITADLKDASAEGNQVVFTGVDQRVPALIYHHLRLSGSGIKTFQTGLNKVNGDLTMDGSTQASTKEAFQIGGHLTVGDGNLFTVTNAITVGGTTTVGTGEGGSLLITAVAGTKTFVGKLIVSPKATFSNSANDNVHYQAGIDAAGTFVGGTAVHYFENNAQEISGNISVTNVFLNTGIVVTNNGTLTVSSLLTGAGTFRQGPQGVLNLGGVCDVRKLELTEPGHTVNYTGGNQDVFPGSYFNLGLGGTTSTAVKSLAIGSAQVRGDLSMTGNASVSTVESMTVMGDLDHSSTKPLVNAHTFTIEGTVSGTGTIEQAAGAVLNVKGAASGVVIRGGTTVNTVNYTAPGAGVLGGDYSTVNISLTEGVATLQGDVLVNASISPGSGSIALGSHNLTLGPAGVLAINNPSASSMVITNGSGELRRSVSSTGTYSFPVGETEGTTSYTPVTIEISAGSAFSQAVIGVSAGNMKASANSSSSNYLNRFWKLYQSGITGCVITFNSPYFSEDVVGQESNIRLASYSGQFNAVTNSWKKIGPIENNLISQGGIALPGQVATIITGIGLSSPVATISGGDGPAICIGSSVPLTAGFTGEGTPSFVWTPAAGLSSPSASQTQAGPATTTTYTLTVFDANGASATATTTVTIQQPVVTAPDAEVCTGGSVALNASGAVEYAWSPAAGLSAVSGSSVTATLTQSTEYLVIGKDVKGCADSARVKVTVNPFPGKAGITGQNLLSDRPVLTSSSSAGNQWYRNGTLIQGATGATYTAAESGTYTVRVTTKNCTGPVSDEFVLVIVGLEGTVASGRIYPNPSEGLTTLDLEGFDRNRPLAISILDGQGRLLMSRLLEPGDPVLDVSTVPTGLYFLTAEQGARRLTQKFIRK